MGEILVTTDMVGIYPNISHIEGLEVLRKQYHKFLHKKVPTEDIIEMAENVLKKVFLSLISNFSNKYVEPLLVLNLLPPIYDCIFMDFIETEFLKTQSIKLSVWKRFIDDIFFIWTDSEKNLERFSKELNGFPPSIKLTFEKSKMEVNFLDVVIKIKNKILRTDLCSELVDSYQYLHFSSCHEEHTKNYHLQSNFEGKKNLPREERSQVF